MFKRYSTTQTLIIVESPAKCTKIEQILGPGYKCIACFGHIRELVSLDDINIQNNFKPTFTRINSVFKKRQYAIIKKAIQEADDVILACDFDREGESICWHLCKCFKLSIQKTKRIIFTEITETAIKKAIIEPTTINMNIVNAQITRQILDMLVGFKITPMLWKFISEKNKNSLSAGRCQTPALRLIYDNEKDITESGPVTQIYNTIGYFTNMNIPFELNYHFDNESDLVVFLNETTHHNHIYNCNTPVKIIKPPPEPFTTSRLQQVASNEFHFSPKDTMKLCQTLYESGYITYMRTDCKKYSSEFVGSIKEYIIKKYEHKYISDNIDLLISSREKECIEQQSVYAHEAIRCTNIYLTELPKGASDPKERKLYKLIWENSLESCMSSAVSNSVKATIQTCQNKEFNHTSELIHFPGWKIVKNKYSTNNKEFQYLQSIKCNSSVCTHKIKSSIIFSNVKHHYTEARLIHLLEEKGIGRPSTYSNIIDKIQFRGYVSKTDIAGKNHSVTDYEVCDGSIIKYNVEREFGNEKSKLVIKPLGLTISTFLHTHFFELFDYDFTQQMECELDKIANNESVWYDVCKQINDKIDATIERLSIDLV